MSSLCQLPAIINSLGKGEKVAIFTANSKTFTPMKSVVANECCEKIFEDRFVIVGCQDIDGFDAVENGTKVDRQRVMPGIVNMAKDVMKEHPDLRVIVFECTELPYFSNAVRAVTGLPVYDVITASNSFMSGVQESTFGVGNC